MGKKSKVPKAPNYSGLAQQQGAENLKNWETGVNAARPNQNNPMGSVSWDKDPTTGEWTQNTTWNPQQQEIFNAQQGNQQTIANKAGGMLGGLDTSQIDLSQAPTMPEVGGYDQRMIDTINQLQQPGLDQARSKKEAQLAAMGVGTGTGRAWNTEQGNIGDTENRSRLNAVLAGINQGNTAFGQGMLRHTTGVNDILNQRTGNLAQISGLMGLGQNLTTPQFANVGSVGQPGGIDYMGAANSQYGAALDKSNAANADKSNTMKGIGTAAQIGASIF
jgi:hypothetical protein